MMDTVWQSLLCGKQAIDPPMPSKEKKVIKDNDKVVEVSGEEEDNTGKDVDVPKKVTPIPRPPSISSKISEKTEGGKYRRFITTLRSFLSMSLW